MMDEGEPYSKGEVPRPSFFSFKRWEYFTSFALEHFPECGQLLVNNN